MKCPHGATVRHDEILGVSIYSHEDGDTLCDVMNSLSGDITRVVSEFILSAPLSDISTVCMEALDTARFAFYQVMSDTTDPDELSQMIKHLHANFDILALTGELSSAFGLRFFENLEIVTQETRTWRVIIKGEPKMSMIRLGDPVPTKVASAVKQIEEATKKLRPTGRGSVKPW